MHPILSRRGRLPLYLLAWLPIGVLLAALLAGTGGLRFATALVLSLPLALVYAFLSLAAWYVCRMAPLGKTGAARLLATHAGAALLSSFVWLAIGRGLASLASRFAPLAGIEAAFDAKGVLIVAAGTLLFALSVAVHYLIEAFEASRAAERRALELEVLAREAELRALRAQIDPHFLFNSLNSVSALAGSDPAAARRMCVLLAEFLRETLRIGGERAIRLEEEVELARRYLAIEQVRLGARLRFDLSVDEEARACAVPPLVLQPLVENAVHHGIGDLVEGGTVLLEARRRGDRVEIVVENPCDPARGGSGRRGLGLDNIRRRVESLYGRDGALAIENGAGRFRVAVTLPAETRPRGGASDGR